MQQHFYVKWLNFLFEFSENIYTFGNLWHKVTIQLQQFSKLEILTFNNNIIHFFPTYLKLMFCFQMSLHSAGVSSALMAGWLSAALVSSCPPSGWAGMRARGTAAPEEDLWLSSAARVFRWIWYYLFLKYNHAVNKTVVTRTWYIFFCKCQWCSVF